MSFSSHQLKIYDTRWLFQDNLYFGLYGFCLMSVFLKQLLSDVLPTVLKFNAEINHLRLKDLDLRQSGGIHMNTLA